MKFGLTDSLALTAVWYTRKKLNIKESKNMAILFFPIIMLVKMITTYIEKVTKNDKHVYVHAHYIF